MKLLHHPSSGARRELSLIILESRTNKKQMNKNNASKQKHTENKKRVKQNNSQNENDKTNEDLWSPLIVNHRLYFMFGHFAEYHTIPLNTRGEVLSLLIR